MKIKRRKKRKREIRERGKRGRSGREEMEMDGEDGVGWKEGKKRMRGREKDIGRDRMNKGHAGLHVCTAVAGLKVMFVFTSPITV